MADPAGPRVVLALQVGERWVPLLGVDRSTRCDLGLVDDLLQLQLAARQHGLQVRLTHVDERLRELFTLVGLDDLLDPPQR